eukprot:1628834-Prymnesium_polylepis.1
MACSLFVPNPSCVPPFCSGPSGATVTSAADSTGEAAGPVCAASASAFSGAAAAAVLSAVAPTCEPHLSDRWMCFIVLRAAAFTTPRYFSR